MDRNAAMIVSLLCVFLLYGTVPSVQAERHSLYYIYTGLSKPVDLPGIYEFSAMGLLDDTQIDYYNSEKKRMIPKQSWMREKLPVDYWDKNTQSTVGKELCFNMDVQIVMDRMKHNKSDLHVLQLRQGCEVELQGDEVKFLKGISEYGYDGGNFLSFDINESQWVAPVVAALPTKRKWDNMPINQYTKGYLEKECVDWLKKYREYRDENLRNTSPPDVYMFAKMYIKYKTRLKLTCMATGFYHQDLIMNIRKYRASLPEHETKSTGTRPNHDGSFQLRKSVKIKEGDERAVYYCWVSHRTLKEPIINIWDGKCWDCPPETPTGAGIGVVIKKVVEAVTGAVIGAVIAKMIEEVIGARIGTVVGAGIGAGIGSGIGTGIGTVIEGGIGAGIGVVLVLAVVALGIIILKKKMINGRGSTGEISDAKATSSQEDINPLISAENMASVPEHPERTEQ